MTDEPLADPNHSGQQANPSDSAGGEQPALQRVAIERVDEVVFISFPQGKADGIAVRELYEITAQLLGERALRVVIDLTQAEFVPSGMMGMLVTVKKKFLTADGSLQVVIADPMVRESFFAMRLDRVLSIHENVPDAVAHFEA